VSASANGHLDARVECEASAGQGRACHLALKPDPEVEERRPDPDEVELVGGCATPGAGGSLTLLGLGLLLALPRRRP
jgi:MYXO-CTERM domain-containing protein